MIRAAMLSALLLTMAQAARADEVGCTSTTFNLFTPNDKVCVFAFDDPKVPGVSCHAGDGGWVCARTIGAVPPSGARFD